jgi:cohesin domain-containing protein
VKEDEGRMSGTRRWLRRAPAIPRSLAVLLLALAASACKQAVDLGDLVGSVPHGSKLTADFQPATIPPGVTNHYVALQKSVASGDQVTIDVIVTNVSEAISGIAIKLSYDTSVGAFVGCADGTLFQPGTCYAVEQPPGSGVVFVGRSVTAPEPAVVVTGSRPVVRLAFRLTRAGQSSIVFEAQNLSGGDATALLDANGDPIFVTWLEGSLVAN